MFFDCGDPASGELIVVEGRDAANAVNRVRDHRTQAVIALQGKVPNCSRRGGMQKALNNDHVAKLLDTMQLSGTQMRYSRLLLLCDADTDGLHARALLGLFLSKHCPEILQQEHVLIVHTPLYQCRSELLNCCRFAWNKQQMQVVKHELHAAGGYDVKTDYFKGIASMPADTLWISCINPESRTTGKLRLSDGAAL